MNDDSKITNHAMLLSVAAALPIADFAAPEFTDKVQPIGRGIVVGHDSGGKRKEPRVSRNAPCPCGSGMKFKKCCIGKGGE